MIPAEIIRKKRDRLALQVEDIRIFFGGISEGTVCDYQASAMLMAIFLQGMREEEVSELTKAMRDSGEVLTWEYPKKYVVDKHSTGGVGDKTSLILLPLCVLNGLRVPMISGRGLGHTGGTLDKLESIPGMRVKLDPRKGQQIVEEHGGVFLGQTDTLAPLDRKLYALRDVTATVESIPLITASILSKKLAAGLGSLVMDVKFGSGAFMQKFSDAKKLAVSIQKVAKLCGLNVVTLVTSMEQPLGKFAGNFLEVYECLEVLSGNGPEDTRALSIELAAHMIHLAYPQKNLESIRATLEKQLQDGSALKKFKEIVRAQGGDIGVLEQAEKRVSQLRQVPVHISQKRGYVHSVDVRKLGLAVQELGGGRKRAEDKIDHDVGLGDLLHVGDKLDANTPVAIIYCKNGQNIEAAQELVRAAYKISKGSVRSPKLIRKVIGVKR